MTDVPEKMVPVFLTRLDTKMNRLTVEITDLKGRVSAVEIGLNAVQRDLVQV
jgi:hypothetical protein